MHVQGGENVNTFDIRIFFSNGAGLFVLNRIFEGWFSKESVPIS